MSFSINALRSFPKSLKLHNFPVNVRNKDDKFLVKRNPFVELPDNYMNCISLINLTRSKYLKKNNFLETLSDEKNDSNVGSILWWKDFLGEDLKKFDITKKYTEGSLLLKTSYPRHAAFIYRNSEENLFTPLNTQTCIAHLVMLDEKIKQVKLDSLYYSHTSLFEDEYGRLSKSQFEYVCPPEIWLNKR